MASQVAGKPSSPGLEPGLLWPVVRTRDATFVVVGTRADDDEGQGDPILLRTRGERRRPGR